MMDNTRTMPRATPPSSLGDFHQTGLGTLAGSGAFGSGTPQTRPASSDTGFGFVPQGEITRGTRGAPQTRPASSDTGFGLVTKVTITVTTRSATKAAMAP